MPFFSFPYGSCRLAIGQRRATWVLGALAAIAVSGLLNAAFAQTASDSRGLQIYKSGGCFACDGEVGNGGAGPRLRGNPFLSVTDYVVAQILLGRNIMPAFGEALNDQQIAAVADYIRNSWVIVLARSIRKMSLGCESSFIR